MRVNTGILTVKTHGAQLDYTYLPLHHAKILETTGLRI